MAGADGGCHSFFRGRLRARCWLSPADGRQKTIVHRTGWSKSDGLPHDRPIFPRLAVRLSIRYKSGRRAKSWTRQGAFNRPIARVCAPPTNRESLWDRNVRSGALRLGRLTAPRKPKVKAQIGVAEEVLLLSEDRIQDAPKVSCRMRWRTKATPQPRPIAAGNM